MRDFYYWEREGIEMCYNCWSLLKLSVIYSPAVTHMLIHSHVPCARYFVRACGAKVCAPSAFNSVTSRNRAPMCASGNPGQSWFIHLPVARLSSGTSLMVTVHFPVCPVPSGASYWGPLPRLSLRLVPIVSQVGNTELISSSACSPWL